MKREDLEKLSDREIDWLIAEHKYSMSTDKDIQRRFNKGMFDYCNNPNDMMPLVFESGISLVFMEPDYEAHSLKNGDEANNTQHNNGLRAAAIVYLLMQDD